MDKRTLEKEYQQFCHHHGLDMSVAPEDQAALSAEQICWLEAHMESLRQLILAEIDADHYVGTHSEGECVFREMTRATQAIHHSGATMLTLRPH